MFVLTNKNRHSRKYYNLILYHCVILLQFRNNLTTFFMMFFKQIIKSEIIECKTNIEFYKTLIVHLYVTKRIESVAVQKAIWWDAIFFFYYSAIWEQIKRFNVFSYKETINKICSIFSNKKYSASIHHKNKKNEMKTRMSAACKHPLRSTHNWIDYEINFNIFHSQFFFFTSIRRSSWSF